MKNIQKIKAQVLVALMVIGISACSKDNSNINDLSETIYVRHKKADMPAWIRGNGSEKVFLIILHGGPGGTGLSYRASGIRTEVEKNNAVVYFDQRGSGSSQGNYSKKDVNIDIMAEDVLALAKVIRSKYGADSKLFLMGHSWGGALGPATLLKNQELFSGWIDVDGAHDFKGLYKAYKTVLPAMAETQIEAKNSVSYWERVQTLVQNIGAYSLNNVYTLNGAAHNAEARLAADDVVNKTIVDFGNDNYSENAPIVSWNANQISRILDEQGINENLSFTNRLSEITIPSLVLWGRYDIVVPAFYAQEAYDNLGSSDKEIFIFERSAHSPMFNQPQLFADKVIDFINQHK